MTPSRAPGVRIVGALLATLLILGGAMLTLLGVIALAYHVADRALPLAMGIGVTVLGASIVAGGWLLGRRVRQA